MNNREEVIRVMYGIFDRDNSLSRCCAVRALEKFACDDDETKRMLIELLLDEDPDVRMDAANALGTAKDENAVEPLVRNMEGDPDGEVRIQVVKALARIKSDKAVDPLIRCLEAEGYPELEGPAVDDLEFPHYIAVHVETLNAIGAIGDPRAADAVIELVESEDYEDIQETGFRVLAQLSSDRAKEYLLGKVKNGHRLIRRRAIKALTHLPEFKGQGGEPSPDILKAVTKALGDSDSGVRSAAAQVLGGTRNPLSVIPLTMLLSDPDVDVRSEVAAILGKTHGPELIDRLHPMLEEDDLKLKCAVIRVLGEIGDPSSFELIAAQLDTGDENLLYETVRALGHIPLPGREKEFAAILDDQRIDPSLRCLASLALGRMLKNAPADEEETEEGVAASGDEDEAANEGEEKEEGEEEIDPLEVLERLVHDDNERIRYAAITALIERSPQAAAGMLVELIRGGMLRKEADAVVEAALGEAGSGEEAEEAPMTPEEADLDERTRAIEKMAGEDPKSSTLASIMADVPGEPSEDDGIADVPVRKAPEKTTRILATRLLGQIDDVGPDAVDTLIEVAEEEGDDAFLKEVIATLGVIGDEKGLPTVLKGLDSENDDVRLRAMEAAGKFESIGDMGEILDRMFNDPDPFIRQRVVYSLSANKNPNIVAYLSSALEDENMNVCRTALEALSKDVHDDECYGRAVNLLFRFSGDLRNNVGAALRRMDDFTVVDKLLESLNDDEMEEFHWICIDALAEMYAEI